MRKPFQFDSFEEIKIKGYKWFKEDSDPLAILIISHGMAETILRYEEFAEFLVKSGIFVYGHSHRGHFETAGKVEKSGYIGKDGWHKMVEDQAEVVRLAKSEYPNKKVFIFGHSMGSYVTRNFLINHCNEIDGVILSGTGYPKKIEIQLGIIIGRIELLFKRKDVPSKFLDKMSFGTYNKMFYPNITKFDWLSKDKNAVRAYVDNPWCGNVHPTSFFIYMLEGLMKILYIEKTEPQKEIPMLLMSGAIDPVGQCGKGVKKSEDFYKKLNYKTEIKLYEDGRHEMLNETNRIVVMSDVLKWLKKYI